MSKSTLVSRGPVRIKSVGNFSLTILALVLPLLGGCASLTHGFLVGCPTTVSEALVCFLIEKTKSGVGYDQVIPSPCLLRGDVLTVPLPCTRETWARAHVRVQPSVS
jgi:hypothetical protein